MPEETARRSSLLVMVLVVALGGGLRAQVPGTASTLPTGGRIDGGGPLSCRVLMETEMAPSCDTCFARALEGRAVGLDSRGVQVVIGPGGLTLTADRPRFSENRMTPSEIWSATVQPLSFTIGTNTRTQISAYLHEPDLTHSFVLNRLNGLAVWSKTRASLPNYSAPLTMSTYLSCLKKAG